MPFFQNPFSADFLGVWVLGDRQHSLTFKCPRNSGRGDDSVVSYNFGPYDLSGTDADGDNTNTLIISYDKNNSKNWTDLSINIAGTTPAATTATEIVTILNNNAFFSTDFSASIVNYDTSRQGIRIRQTKGISNFKFFIKNVQAETKLNFNKHAGVSELPNFFDRHSTANGLVLGDSQNMLVALDPGTYDVDANVIDNAVDFNGTSLGLDSGTIQADYLLLKGRSGLFMFYKHTVDASSRITETIEYHAGSVVGDMAKKTTYAFTGAKTQPDKKVEVPYVLQSGDLVTP